MSVQDKQHINLAMIKYHSVNLLLILAHWPASLYYDLINNYIND